MFTKKKCAADPLPRNNGNVCVCMEWHRKTVVEASKVRRSHTATHSALISIMQIEKAHRIMYSPDPKAICNGKANVPVSCQSGIPHDRYIHHEPVSPRCAQSSRNARDNVHNPPQCLCACSSLCGELCGSNLFLYVYMRILMHTWSYCQLASLHWLFGLVA